MNLFWKLVVLAIILVTITESLVCETCDGSTCFDRERWLQEHCPPSTQYCYRLSIGGKAFRRGCSDYPCSTLPGVESNMECRTCSHDRCNNERDHFFYQHGGGSTWKKSATTIFSIFPAAIIIFYRL